MNRLNMNPLHRAKDVIKELAQDLALLGHAGETNSAKLLYLCAISRRLLNPSSACVVANSASGKSELKRIILSLQVPEEVVNFSRMTQASLSSMAVGNPDILRNKVLSVEEVEGAQGTFFELRTLLSENRLSVRRGGVNGGTHVELNGPTVYLVTTTPDASLDYQTFNRMTMITMDSSAEQTKRVLEAQAKKAAGKLEGNEEEVIERHHEFQKSLVTGVDVQIPFAENIVFPFHNELCRREFAKALNLIKACAYLHQHDRKQETVGGKTIIFAAEADFHTVIPLVEKAVLKAVNTLPAEEELILNTAEDFVEAKKLAGQREVFARTDLLGPTGMHQKTVARKCEILCEKGYFRRTSGRKGQEIEYRINLDFMSSMVRKIELQPKKEKAA